MSAYVWAWSFPLVADPEASIRGWFVGTPRLPPRRAYTPPYDDPNHLVDVPFHAADGFTLYGRSAEALAYIEVLLPGHAPP